MELKQPHARDIGLATPLEFQKLKLPTSTFTRLSTPTISHNSSRPIWQTEWRA